MIIDKATFKSFYNYFKSYDYNIRFTTLINMYKIAYK